MKKIYSFVIALFVAQMALAQWPANYPGVMLQAFYWNSFQDTKWTKLTSQAEDNAKYFDVMWVPNSGDCRNNVSMGYLPVYWLDHNRSAFGTKESELTDMIQAYNARGTKVIMDLVVNHKAPIGKNGSWIDFANENRTGKDGTTQYKLEWTGADICINDDGGDTKNRGWDVSGANDTGTDFSGARDLDHTSSNVQQNIITYMKFLKQELGYSGFRLDMVKGYSGYYNKVYNEAVVPEFCVGEFWDGKDAITHWIDETGKTSAAFDFPLKYQINKAFGSGDWSALNDKGLTGDPYWSRYSVSFIDNHDTYENEDRLVNNVLPANAFILALPGTPCIFLKHWQKYPIAIGNMILARKAAGINNQSQILEAGEVGGGYVTKVQGTMGTVLCMSGYVQGYNTEGYKCIMSGDNYAYFVSENVTVEGLREGNDLINPDIKPTVYVEAVAAPFIYSWTEGGEPRSGAWPGSQMTDKVSISGAQFYKWSFDLGPMNIILNNGNGEQTSDIKNLTHDYYFTYDGSSGYSDITARYWKPAVPYCVKPVSGKLYCYFRGNKDFKAPIAWVWGKDGKVFCVNQNFPGDKLRLVGYDDDNYPVYYWGGPSLPTDGDMPTNILFTNEGNSNIRTGEFEFANGNYYDVTGYIGTAVPTGIAAIAADKKGNYTSTAPVYNLNGQRVNTATYRGLVIQNGTKRIAK